jgi:hypothetical protein
MVYDGNGNATLSLSAAGGTDVSAYTQDSAVAAVLGLGGNAALSGFTQAALLATITVTVYFTPQLPFAILVMPSAQRIIARKAGDSEYDVPFLLPMCCQKGHDMACPGLIFQTPRLPLAFPPTSP